MTMRITSVIVIVFLLSAFSIGISLKDNDMSEINLILDNVTVTATNFTLQNVSNNSYVEGGYHVLEKFIHFVIVAMTETMRAGILFGHSNPEYFDPAFILNIARAFMWVAFLSLAIVPLMYLIAFFIMLIIWISGIKERRRLKDARQF